MTPELWQRLKPLFHEALDLGGEDRATFIGHACGDDAELKENLLKLIEAAEERTRTFDGPLVRFAGRQESRFHPGEVLLERFRIVRPIGSGGMGEVYEAEDLQLGRIALKTIRDGIASSSHAFDRFRQEVQLARKVSGAEVCRIHELYLLPASGTHPATAFLTMEYLDGITLADKLTKDGPFQSKEALRVALDICAGLGLVHGNSIVHRDLKSANIMLCRRGDSSRAVLMDFGLARDSSSNLSGSDDAGTAERRVGTIPGTIMGTPAYMAPEQFEGKPVSPATDIYALGIVLYELVTGLHPYAAPTPVAAAIRRAQHTAPPSSLNRAIPRKWDRIIHRCLGYDAAERFQSAEEVATALRAGRANLSNIRKDRPLLFGIACAALLAMLAWGAISAWQFLRIYRPRGDVKSLYDEGVLEMQNGQYVLARNSFDEAVKRDDEFAMAHARLAEALYELDLPDSALRELMKALPGRDRLASLDKMYLDAIDATVMGKFSDSLDEFTRIFRHLPRRDRSSGYVDLGMAYERSGDVPSAVESYRSAASENIDNPAAYLHSGILQSRGEDYSKAAGNFKHAEEIYKRKGTDEGIAELEYEEGYAANANGDPKAAEAFLTDARQKAEESRNIPLEVRVLTQLSSAEYGAKDSSAAEDYAQRARDMARDNRLDPSWIIYGWVRLAGAKLAQKHAKDAEEPIRKAMEILEDNPNPRALALANVTWAGIKMEEGAPREAITPAKEALEYYEKNGFFEPAAKASILITQATNSLGQSEEALASSKKLIELANKSGNLELEIQAAETEAIIYFGLEDYPRALDDFSKAKKFADDNKGPIADYYRMLETANCADLPWRLGRPRESDTLLDLAAKDARVAESVAQSRVESKLSQRQYRSALAAAQQEIAVLGKETSETKWQLQQDAWIAEAYLGMKGQVMAELAASAAPNDHKGDAAKEAKDKLAVAEVLFALGLNQRAFETAAEAEQYFASKQLYDSDLRSASLAAMAAKAMKKKSGYKVFSQRAIDIRDKLKQNWGPDAFQQYISRQDLQFLNPDAAKDIGAAAVRTKT